MPETTQKRFSDAIAIQGGACNVVAIVNSLLAAAKDAREENVQPCEDPAVRLIVHQLAHLCNNHQVDTEPSEYNKLVEICEQNSGRKL